MADVIIVGGGPSGSTLAQLLTCHGIDVLVLDRAAFPRHKPCAEYLSPGTVALLHQLGVGDAVEARGSLLRGFRVSALGREEMAGVFGQAAGWRDAPDHGLGVPRATLDALLLDQARTAGTCVVEQAHVRDVLRDGNGRVAGVKVTFPDGEHEFRAPLVVGADGVNGVIGRRLGMTRLRRGMRRLSLVAHMAGIDGLSGLGEMHVGRHGYCGVAPLGDGVANVALVLHGDTGLHLGGGRADGAFLDLVRGFSGMAPRMERARVVRPVLRTGPLSLRAHALVGDGVLLAGDAGGFYDPFTGQGVYKALRSAMIAAPVIAAALRSGDTSRRALLPYQEARLAEFRGPLAVEWLIQRFLGRPALLRRAVRLLGRRPAMADTLVGVTGDVLPARRVLSPFFLARLAV